MLSVLSFLRLILLVFAISALTVRAKKALGRVEIALPVVFAGIGSVIFLAGILNVLREVSIAIVIVGLLTGISDLRAGRICWRKPPYALLFAFVLSAALFFTLYKTRLIVYDDFSHWGLSLKYMLKSNRFPNFMDRNLSFTSYQLGSTGFLYFVLWTTGIHAEWFAFFVYALLQMIMFLPLFAFFHGVIARLVTGLAICLMLAFNGGIGTLVVDTLLSGSMAAGLMICLYFRSNLREKFWAVVLISAFLVSIKTTGVLYAVLLLMYALYCIGWQKHDTRLLFSALVPFVIWYFWVRHVKLVFANGMNSRHAVSLAWFSSVLHGKSVMNIVKLTAKMALRFISPTNPFVLLLLFWLIEGHFAKKRHDVPTKADRTIELFVLGSTVVYEIGLWAMYVFSMPQPDAAILSSYERYYMTHMFVIIPLALIRYANLLEKVRLFEKNKQVRRAALSISLAFFLGFFGALCQIINHALHTVFDEHIRQNFEVTIAEEHLPSDARYLLILAEDDYGYARYVFTYLLDPISVQSASTEDLMKNKQDWIEYDYVVVPDCTEEVEIYLRDQLHVESSCVIPVTSILEASAP